MTRICVFIALGLVTGVVIDLVAFAVISEFFDAPIIKSL